MNTSLTKHVDIFDGPYSPVVTATAHKNVLLNGAHINSVLNDRTFTDSMELITGADFGMVLSAISDVVSPTRFAAGRIPEDEVPTKEFPEDAAMRLWPNNTEAQEAFKLGCDFYKNVDDNWDRKYKEISKKHALLEIKKWAEDQEADVSMLESLSDAERLTVFKERVRVAALNKKMDSDQGYDW